VKNEQNGKTRENASKRQIRITKERFKDDNNIFLQQETT
jgi:hypothetical protein